MKSYRIGRQTFLNIGDSHRLRDYFGFKTYSSRRKWVLRFWPICVVSHPSLRKK